MDTVTQHVETWRPTHLKPWYEVSSLGRVRNSRTGRILKNCGPYRNNPYYDLNLGAGTHAHVHVLVCWAFHGPRPSPRHEAAHANGNHLDNRAENLRWATKAENMQDCVDHGTHRGPNIRGVNNWNAKLNDEAVREIRRLVSAGLTSPAIAERVGVAVATVRNVRQGRAWRHVT